MYKAIDSRTNKEIIILDPKWLNSIVELRSLDHQDFLICQGCKQPVRVRAGEERRKHFAHKHLANCDYDDESITLLNARAVLYEWLVDQFKDNVTIEKRLDNIDLFRPIDCLVENDSKTFAYWIFDSPLKPEKREFLQQKLENLKMHISWVFTSKMLRTEKDDENKLILTTTERDFMRRSKYDVIYANHTSPNGSLHYLDSENRRIVSIRNLSLYHEPQVYEGTIQVSNLEKVSISLENGEFIHDGEDIKLKIHNEDVSKEINANVKNIDLSINNFLNARTFRKSQGEKSIPQEDNSLLSKAGLCIFCGETTRDWWSYDGKTGQCKCNSCLKQGKS